MNLQEAVERALAASHLDTPSIAIKRLGTAPESAVVDPGRPLYPASMIKTPLVLAVLALIDRGSLAPDRLYSVDDANMTENDTQSPLVPGYRAALLDLMELAISISDNVATNMLFDIAGREHATAIVQNDFGLQHTRFARKLSGAEPLIADPGWNGVDRNAHPAEDAAALFELIALGRAPAASALQAMLGRQHWNNKLSPGWNPGDRFAHKTGDTSEVTHDGGILQTSEGRTYVIVVYTGMASTDENNARFGAFAGELRPLL